MSNYDCKGCKHRTNHTDEGFKFCSGCDRAYGGADRGYHADRYEKEEAEISMAKAILVMDMPKSCDECSFETEVRMGGYAKSYCGVPGCGKYTDDYIACRAEFCPLKPMPEKRDMRFLDDASEYYRQGWNACIDAICGKE